jgi:hypothetical protein
MNTLDRDWVLSELARTLRALAVEPNDALAALPADCVKADELALDFESVAAAVLGNMRTELTRAQVTAIEAVDRELLAMSSSEHPELWTEHAVREHPRWKHIRTLASSALQAAGAQNAG